MINTQLINQIASSKSDIKNDTKGEIKEKDLKLDTKEALNKALRQNLGLNQNASKEEVLEKFIQNETGVKLKELVNKLLEQINAQKNPNSPVLKQGAYLNLAPNFANELKKLSTELSKNDTFSQALEKINQILKPASEIKNNNLAPLFKNTGVFFEAKLKNALQEEQLPKSFHVLLNTIKSLSSEKLSSQISNLAQKDLNPKESLKELQNIIHQNKNEAKEILKNSTFKALITLSSKVQNFKNFINKNPAKAEAKIEQISNKILKELQNLKNNFISNIQRPENLMIKEPMILKQAFQAFEKLENTLKNYKNSQNKTNINPEKNLDNHNLKEMPKIQAKEENHTKEQEINTKDHSNQNDTKIQNHDQEIVKDKNTDQNTKETIDKKRSDDINNHSEEKIQNNNEKQENLEQKISTQEEKIQEKTASHAKDKVEKNEEKSFSKIPEKENTKDQIKNNANINTNNINSNNINQNNTSLNIQNLFKNEEWNKQGNFIKNLAFSTENGNLEKVEILSKDLSRLLRKINESLKELDPQAQNAKTLTGELKNLEHKLNLSQKDLQNITAKTSTDINKELHNDVKSTLLQISNLAKNEANEAIYNQANRLLAQIELNQLMSLANDSINTYLPFSWEDLNDSKIMFRRGKKDKFFAQIKLEFAKLGSLEILISLNNEKYIDINIMAENKIFRKTIYENAHELKRNINKAGLLSANFFVGDIIRTSFDHRNLKNYDLDIGMDKSV